MSRYFAAALIMAGAIAIRLIGSEAAALGPAPFALLFIGAVTASAIRGGFGPGAFATPLGALGLWLPQAQGGGDSARGLRVAERAEDLVLLLSYVGLGLAGSWMGAALRAARRQVLAATAEGPETRPRHEAEPDRLSASFDSFMASASVGLAVLDRDFRYFRINETLAAINGLSVEAHLGRKAAEVVPTIWPILEPVLLRVRDGGESITGLELSGRSVWKASGIMTCLADFFPIRLEGEELTGVGIAVMEVTPLKRAEDQARRSEERFRMAADSVNGLLYDADPKTRTVWRSPALKGLLGFAPEEADPSYEWWWDRIHPDDRERLLKLGQEQIAARRERYSGEYRLRHRDGHYIQVWEQGRAEYDSDGAPARMMGFTVDVTAQRRQADALADAHRRLEESFALLDTLIDKAPIGLAFVNPELRFVRVNKHLAALDGFPAHQTIGKPVAEVVPQLWPKVGPLYRQALSGEPVVGVEIEGEVGSAPGELRHFIVSYYPVRTRDAIIGVGVAVAEITEQKRVQEELRAADRRKDEFLATLAHELRNPLAPMRTALQVIKLSEGDGAAIDRYRLIMERQMGQMTRLIDDLMDVSRISRGKLELRKERVALASVLSSAIETSRPLIEEMGHELIVELPEELVILDADLVRLAQVFLNLLNNSAKYMDRGGRIWVTAKLEGSEAVVSVKDAGIGIAAEQLPRIFQLFSQADRSLERAQGGLGIGLSLVKRLTEMHGGTIEARSAGIGQGAEFIVRLPIAAEGAGISPKRADERRGGLEIAAADPSRG